MQSVLTVVCSTLFASRGYHGAHTIPRSLRYAAKRLYELCPKSFLTRRNRRNSPSMARFLLASASMPRHFCALQHNSTDTKQLRYSPALQYRLPPPPAYATYAEIQCAGPHLRFGRHGALSLHVGSSKPTTLPTRHTKLAAGHAVCSEGNYELPRGSIFPNNKKSPGISSIYPYMGSGLPS